NAYAGAGNTGVVGRIQLVLSSNRIPGVQFDGEFLLEINTFATARDVETFLIDESTGRFQREANNRLRVGTVSVASGVRLLMGGNLILGNSLTLQGTFKFIISPGQLEVDAHARLRLNPIGEVQVSGGLRINSEGLVARVALTLDASFGGSIGLQFEVGASLDVNTTGRDQQLEGDPTPIVAGVRI